MSLEPKDAALLIDQTRSEKSILVGGQAVDLWRKRFDIQPRLAALTVDIDFLATRAEARKVAARLTIPHRLNTATIDDHTPNSAVLSVILEGYEDAIVIDFMASIIGVDSKALEKAAVEIEFIGRPLRIIHPLHLLEAKISNLYQLSAKRTPEGIEQARLAIEIAAAYLEQADLIPRERLNAIEKIARFSATSPAQYAAENFMLNCLKAVPDSLLREGALPEDFLKKRWPRILANAGRR